MRAGKGRGVTWLLCGALCMGMLWCAGCGGTGEAANEASKSPSATSSLASQAKTDLGRRILADGEVSAEEWAEAKQAYTDCIHERVDPEAEVTWENDRSSAGGIRHPGMTIDKMGTEYEKELDDGDAACETDTDFDVISRIQDLGNEPDRDAVPELVQCLVSKGLVDSSMTVEEYKQIISDPDRSSEAFGAYYDPSNPRYDEQKAQQWQACQEGGGGS